MEEKKADFARRGLNVAVITYDSQAVLKHFAGRKKISIPLLSDQGSKTIRAFGIFNESVAKDSFAYGVPHPGTYVLDAKGRVTAKYFEEDYRDRVTAGGILVRRFAAPTGGRMNETTTPHLKARTWASNDTVYVGSRITLVTEVELPPKMHIYAPGVNGYIPVNWSVGDPKGWTNFEVTYPKSKVIPLKAIGETVPAYVGKAWLVRDIKIGQTRELRSILGPDRKLVVKDTLRYQACDDKKCYIPESIPLQWELTVNPSDSERVPEAIRGVAK